MNDIKTELKTGVFKRAYVFFGEEEYLRTSYEKRLTDALMPEDVRLMDLNVIDGKQYRASDLSAACETPPLAAEYRLTVFKDTGLFASGKKDETEAAERILSAFFAAGERSTNVVLFSESAVDKRGRLYKIIDKAGGATEFKTPPEKQLIGWAAGIFKKEGYAIEASAAALLVRYASDMRQIVMETEKLIAYKGDDRVIREADIELICAQSLEYKIFGLIGLIGAKKCSEAVITYQKLIAAKESPLGILNLMARQFGIMLRCSELAKQGKNAYEAASLLKLADFAASEAFRQSRLFAPDTLYAAYAECLDTDVRIKTGNITDKTGVELLIIKYSKTEVKHAL